MDRGTVDRACQLNDIDRSTRERGLDLLAAAGRIDIATNGSIAVLGATSLAVLEVTSELFHQARPSTEEHAVLAISAQVETNPQSKSNAEANIGDEFRIQQKKTK